jgi:hypothetical protein
VSREIHTLLKKMLLKLSHIPAHKSWYVYTFALRELTCTAKTNINKNHHSRSSLPAQLYRRGGVAGLPHRALAAGAGAPGQGYLR